MAASQTRRRKEKKKFSLGQAGKIDITFLSLVLILLVVGLIMLFSASYAYARSRYGNSYRFVLRQGILAVLGVGLMLGISKLNCRVLKKFAWLIYVLSLGLLAFLLISEPMMPGTDVKRWMVIGSVSFQPSELAKFALILFLAAYISSHSSQMKSPVRGVVIPAVLIAVPTLLVFKEPHLSATIILVAIGLVMLLVGGIRLIYIIAGGGILAAGAVIVMASGKIGYVADKLESWLDPWATPLGGGYQTIQSLLAVGSGGLFGRGIGQSRQKFWVPEPHNDFIFSIVCEELGLIGALAIVLLFCLLVWRGIRIAMHAQDKFSGLLALGLTFQVGLQAALNILVVTNFVPNTGISLPFFSYGGTSLLLLLAEMGIVLSVSRGADQADKARRTDAREGGENGGERRGEPQRNPAPKHYAENKPPYRGKRGVDSA